MPRIVLSILVLVTGVLLASALSPPPEPQLDVEGLTPVSVLEVLDGGRIKIELMGRVAEVRLLGIAAPDVLSKNQLLAENGAKARDVLVELLDGQEVVLDPDPERNKRVRGPRWPETDRDGNLKAHLWRASDGLLINAELLRRGVVFYNAGTTKREQYIRWYSWCQRQARDAGLGVWSGRQIVAAGTPVKAAENSGMPDISLPGEAATGPVTPPAQGWSNSSQGAVDVTSELTGELDPATELPTGLKLVQATAKVTQRTTGGWDLGWRVGLKNSSRHRQRVDVTVRFLDADGYVLGEDTALNVSLPRRASAEARGTVSMPAPTARRAVSLSVIVERAK
jgi:endonuclease YncB( thermonuclease family)